MMLDKTHGTPPSAKVDPQGHLILPEEIAQDNALEPGSELAINAAPAGMLVRWPVSQLRKVYIEPTSHCNLACRTCMRNAWDEPKGHMARETFNLVIDALADQKPKVTVFFGGFGEPLLHPDIITMVERSARIAASVELITNGILLDARMSEGLIESGLSTLWVSLDGASPESYADVRMSNSLTDVLRNIAAYRELHRRLKRIEPEIGVVFVAMRRNINEFPGLVRQSASLGVSRYMLTNILPYTPEMCSEVLYHHSVDRWGGSPSPWNPNIQVPEIDLDAVTRDTLFKIWTARPGGLTDWHDRCPFIEQRSTSVAWDGSVSPCLGLLHSHISYLFDLRQSIQRYQLGNVNQRSLPEIWLSEEYTRFRQKVEQFDFAPCTVCGGCQMAEANQEDCFGNTFPTCGGCLWAKGVIQCP
jgi:MoaA/NifB/PqqE/SkfB family radical SAM enzyme